MRVDKNEIAKRIGLSVIDSLDNLIKSKGPVGRTICIPINLDGLIPDSNAPWMTRLEMTIPIFVERFIDRDGEAQFVHVSLSDYYGWEKK